jgi:hypothetical protein
VADSKISALTAVTTPAGSQQIPVNDGGTTKRLSLSQVNAYCEPVSGANTAAVAPAAATDTYLSGSGLAITTSRLQAGSFYRLRGDISKTAAGTAAATFNVRFGTAGTTADALLAALALGGQTAVADVGFFELLVNFRVVGASAVVAASLSFWHQLATTGLNTTAAFARVAATSAAFNSAAAATATLGVSLNTGTGAAWTLTTIQADMLNLT